MEAASSHRLGPIIQISINHVVSPRFSRCRLIVSCFKTLAELFHKPHTRELARWNYCIMVDPQDFLVRHWFQLCAHIITSRYKGVCLQFGQVGFSLCYWVAYYSTLIGCRQRCPKTDSSILRSAIIRHCTKAVYSSAMF